uniref:Uncharacterized protein n=1 Tax=viral metagenome TaxID=1070528 RepID=A0A6C0E2N6_9ZZZZ
MNNIDLNIHNYNFKELLGLFKINENYQDVSNKNKINSVVSVIKMNYPDLYPFYLKSQKIVTTLYQIIEKNLIDNDRTKIDDYANKIKRIENFENITEDELVNKIVTTAMKSYNTNINNYSLLNEPSMNIHKLNPGLNNKNNTNLITNTFPNVISPGELNPVKRITQNQNLNLNSCFRHNYYQSNPCDFLYMLPMEIKNVTSMRLVSIELPNAWYLFSHIQKNNMFQIEVKADGNVQTFSVVIPDGNYDVDTLQCYLNTTYFYESSMDTYLKYIKFSIDKYNLKSRFEILENDFTDFRFSLKFVETINQNIMNTSGWILGFRVGNYLDITNKIQSEGLFDAGGDRYIYVCLNDYQYNNNTLNTVCFDKSTLNEDVIAKIPMINGKLALIVVDDNNPLAKIRRYTGPVNISKLHIKLLDKFGTIIDLNNMDFSLTLELEILYESFNFKNVSV